MMQMEVGTVVNLMGVHRRIAEPCDDPECKLNHRDGENGREHLVDGPREGRGAMVVGREPARVFGDEDRYVLRMFTREVVNADAADVEEVAPPTEKTIAFALEALPPPSEPVAEEQPALPAAEEEEVSTDGS